MNQITLAEKITQSDEVCEALTLDRQEKVYYDEVEKTFYTKTTHYNSFGSYKVKYALVRLTYYGRINCDGFEPTPELSILISEFYNALLKEVTE